MVVAQTTIPVLPFPIAVAIVVAVIVGALIISQRLKNRRDLRQYLEPPLRDRGAEFLSAIAPVGWFSVGPFPKVEFRVGPTSHIGPIRGEYCYYRVVKIRDRDGTERELWAVVEFQLFRFAGVRWRAVDKASLSSDVQAMLEN